MHGVACPFRPSSQEGALPPNGQLDIAKLFFQFCERPACFFGPADFTAVIKALMQLWKTLLSLARMHWLIHGLIEKLN